MVHLISRTVIYCLLISSNFIFTNAALAASDLPSRPNILLITADDLGYDDLSIHQNPLVSTPNLDKLAKQSVQFSDFSVTPVCSTTRASLLTGRHFYKTGVSGVHGGRDYMSRSETLISQMLKQNGYHTGLWGKWHIGKSEGYYPWDRGFDEAYYAELYRHKNSFGFLNGEKVEHQKWVSEVVSDYAIDFMQKSQQHQQPFFAYVSFLAPHEPWLAPDKFVKPYLEKGARPGIANLYGMVTEMDFHIGRLLDYLDKTGLADNTLVIFMSDNGPWWDSSNYGAMTKKEWLERNPSKMNGNKGQSWQNGIRSPLFIKMGKHLAANTVERFVDVKDVLPTLLDITDTPLLKGNKPLDGQSFMPYLLGNIQGENNRSSYIASHDVISNKALFNQWTPVDDVARAGMQFSSQLIGLRTEQYKLLLNAAMDKEHYPQPVDGYLMFDMQNDPLESTNIIKQKPDVASSMKTQLQQEFFLLLDSHDSYAPPVYIVGGDQPISVINGFGPAKTGGDTQSKAHQLSGMQQKDDFAEYQIEVLRDSKYKILIKQTNTDAAGLAFRLSVQGNVIEDQFNGELVQAFGELKLKAGLSRLRIEIIENNSIKPWAEVSGLRRIFLVPEASQINPEDFPLPN